MAEIEIGAAASYEEFPAEVEIAYRLYYLMRREEGYVLFSRQCPHAGGTVDFEDGLFVCPLHNWSFHLEDGSCTRFDTKLDAVEVIEKEGKLFAIMG
jgi:nitrite reductase/ring-hydroxylating ferredoxin subunit